MPNYYKNQSLSKNNFLKKNKKTLLAVFLLIIATMGVFIVYRSFASTPPKPAYFYQIGPKRILDTRSNLTPGIKNTLINFDSGPNKIDKGLISQATGMVMNVTMLDTFKTGTDQESQDGSGPLSFLLGQKGGKLIEAYFPGTKEASYGETFKMIVPWDSTNDTDSLELRLNDGYSKGKNLIIDIEGLYIANTSTVSGAYTLYDRPIANKLTYDSRNSGGPLKAGETRLVDLGLNPGSDAFGKTSSVINLTVLNPAADGFIKAWIANENNTVALNFKKGQSATNQIIIPDESADAIVRIKSSASTGIIVSSSGDYYTAGKGLSCIFNEPRVIKSNPGFLQSINWTDKNVIKEKIDINSSKCTSGTITGAILKITTFGPGFVKSGKDTLLNANPTGQTRTSRTVIVPADSAGNVNLEFYKSLTGFKRYTVEQIGSISSR